MITRRDLLTRGIAALAGAAVLGSTTSAALADHRNVGTPMSRTMDRARDGSCETTPDGHPRNHGVLSLRTEGTPVLGGSGQRHGRDGTELPAGARTGNGNGNGTGTGVCDGTGPDQ
jgi:hypothetical protein